MDELERALLERWDRETLLVYADSLQARGDPRGELIALDLEIAVRGPTTELVTRRRKRLYEWLGGSTVRGRPWHEASFHYGFATDFVITHDRNATSAGYAEALFASPAGPYVKGLTIYVGTPKQLRDVIAFLVRAPRLWLERLEIRVVDRDAPLDAHLVDALIAATPRLHTLAVFGAQALAAFPHPAVRALATDAPRLPLSRTLPNVEALDLLLDAGDIEDDALRESDLRTLIATLALRRLDLSRNEPHYPPQVPPNVDIYPFARSLALPALDHLRLPSLRTSAQVDLLHAMLATNPHLSIEIARTHDVYATVLSLCHPHPRLTLPAPHPWPPRDTLSSREALTITVPTEEHGDDVSLTSLIERLEDQFATLPEPSRLAWLDFWAFLAELPWEDRNGNDVTLPFPAKTLLTAVEPLDDVFPASGTAGHWAQLAEKLRAADLPDDAVVTIRRYWGW